MAEQRPKEVILNSPRGVAKWPNLSKPQREIKTKEGIKPVTPNYSLTLLLDPNEAGTMEFVEGLKKAAEDGFSAAKAANPKKHLVPAAIKIADDEDKEGTPTGKIAIGFKCKAEGVKKDGTPWSFRPGVLDAKGKSIPKEVLIYSGSVVKIAYTIKHTLMATGIFYTTFNLKGVQILVLKSQSDRDASYYGFQTEEGYGNDSTNPEDEDDQKGAESYTAGAGNAPAPKSGADF